ncbi:MAG: hypothetical protein IKW21_02905 [Lachnospiraceae bacterium]|nr:hypothetical protein [Lachnospiraceae bacterium]
MAVEFTDNSIQVKTELEAAVIAYLHEAAGELSSQTTRNSRPVNYGQQDVKNSWDYIVDESEQMAVVGSPLEAAYWEELGTGDYALNGDGRKGWWVYVEGNDTPRANQKMYTEEEAKSVAAFLRSKGLPAHASKGTEANRPLFRAFTELKTPLIRRAEEVLGAMMNND